MIGLRPMKPQGLPASGTESSHCQNLSCHGVPDPWKTPRAAQGMRDKTGEARMGNRSVHDQRRRPNASLR